MKSTSLAVLIVALIIVSSAGVYFFLTGPTGNPSQTTSTSSGTSTTSAGEQKVISGAFQWKFPCVGAHGQPCPVGFRGRGSSYADYLTVLSGSGSFEFTLDLGLKTGHGTGQGTVIANTTGFCNGLGTETYAFPVTAYLAASGETVSILFGTPTPINSTLQLACTDENGLPYASSGEYQFISVFPDIVNMAVVPGTVLKGTAGETSYEIVLR